MEQAEGKIQCEVDFSKLIPFMAKAPKQETVC